MSQMEAVYIPGFKQIYYINSNLNNYLVRSGLNYPLRKIVAKFNYDHSLGSVKPAMEIQIMFQSDEFSIIGLSILFTTSTSDQYIDGSFMVNPLLTQLNRNINS